MFSISEVGVYYSIVIHEDVGKSLVKGEEIENADGADSISDELKPPNLMMQSDASTTQARSKAAAAHCDPHKGPQNV